MTGKWLVVKTGPGRWAVIAPDGWVACRLKTWRQAYTYALTAARYEVGLVAPYVD